MQTGNILRLLLFGIVHLTFINVGATQFSPCEPGNATKEMIVGDYTITHKVSGAFISKVNGAGIVLNDEEMSNDPISILNSLGIWASGFDNGGNPKMAIGQDNEQTDWYPGPLSGDGLTNEENCQNYNQIWEITKEEIGAFRCDFGDNQIIDDEHPGIFGWPATGNPHFEKIHGFKLPDDNNGLAPFYDYGDDGVLDGRYNPEKGDIPWVQFFQDNRADRMQFWIINDNGGLHLNSNSAPIRLELQILAFTTENCNQSGSRIYYQIKLVNRATEDLNSFSTGLFADLAIGCAESNMIGIIPEKNLVFAHSNFDEEDLNCYCDNAPLDCKNNFLFGLHQVRGMLDQNFSEQYFSSFVPFADDSLELAEYRLPNSQDEYLNVMDGMRSDGSYIYDGGLGTNDSFPITNFAFDDEPADPLGWSMCQTDFPETKKSFIVTSGNSTLQPGTKSEMIIGLYLKNDKIVDQCPSLYPLFQMELETQSDCVTSNFYACPPVPPVFIPYEISIFPNPSNGNFSIKISEGYSIDIVLRDMLGRLVFEENEIVGEKQFETKLQGTYLLEITSNNGVRNVQKIQFL